VEKAAHQKSNESIESITMEGLAIVPPFKYYLPLRVPAYLEQPSWLIMHILSALFLLGARLIVNWLFVCPHTATSRLAAIKLRIIDNYVDNKADNSQERYFISSHFRLSCCIFNHHHDERSNIVFCLHELFLLISSY
jgi:hypothetical protein